MRFRRDKKVELIHAVPLFSRCSRGEVADVASLADEITLAEGKALTREGETGREFVIILEGTAAVTKDGQHLRDLGPGDFLGEIALIRETPRTATVTAKTPVRALIVTDQAFRSLLDRAPELRRKVEEAAADRAATSGATID